MKLITRQLKFNVTSKDARSKDKCTQDVAYIVIHDTGNKKRGANAEMHFKFFNSRYVGSSADYFVDDKETWKVNDHNLFYTWHVGDGAGKYGIWNKNSIGVEICVNADGDYSKAYSNAVELVKKLKIQYPRAIVVRHYDASRKICPASMTRNNWEAWKTFLNLIKRTTPNLNLSEILKVSNLDDPKEWIEFFDGLVKMAELKGDIGFLEKAKYLPVLVEKIYNNK